MGAATRCALALLLGHAVIAMNGCASAGPEGRSESEAPRALDRSSAAGDANAILKEMTDRYASCKTYQDKGKQAMTLTSDDGSEPAKSWVEFETVFDRAREGFLFRYTESHARFFPPSSAAIWREGPGPARLWHEHDSRTSETNLPGVIYTLAGVSGGTSRVVSTMLMPAPDRPPPFSFELGGEETVDRAACFKLTAHREDREVMLWIGKSDHVLRRRFQRTRIVPADNAQAVAEVAAQLPPDKRMLVEAASKGDPFVSEATTDYAPVLDAEIEPARFKFVPPPSAPAHEP